MPESRLARAESECKNICDLSILVCCGHALSATSFEPCLYNLVP